MMEWLTIDAWLACSDGGGVTNKNSQDWVCVEKRPVLVSTDPEGRSIKGCPMNNVMMGQKPCTTTLKVKTGYSDFVLIGGCKVCLVTVQGQTDGAPAGVPTYQVLTPGQALVVAGS
jgi:hypothetical protein